MENITLSADEILIDMNIFLYQLEGLCDRVPA